MRASPSSPFLYEINTRCWMRELALRAGRPVTLAEVPDEEIHAWRDRGLTHIWLMGVWEIGPRCRKHSLERYCATPAWHRLPEEAVVGSAYAIAGYRVARSLGEERGLQRFRERLANHGLKLILDFIPNHVGLDHPWLTERPELFVQSTKPVPGTFGHLDGDRLWIAHGRDPYFPPWVDTAQLDYRNPLTRAAMLGELQAVAELCDGVRCDMAMLVMEDVFAGTWESLPCPGRKSPGEFWAEAIPAIQKRHSEFLFLGEAYWDLEPRLHALGFAYTYNKTWYDHLVGRRPHELHAHLLNSAPAFLEASIHFLENHDEARAASVWSENEHRAAALLLFSMPGMKLIHDGQLIGLREHAGVHLNCRPSEPLRPEIESLYRNLFEAIRSTAVGRGGWRVLVPSPIDDQSHGLPPVAVIQWQARPDSFNLAMVNLSANSAECRIRIPLDEPTHPQWTLRDRLDFETFECSAEELRGDGLCVRLDPHGAKLLHAEGGGGKNLP